MDNLFDFCKDKNYALYIKTKNMYWFIFSPEPNEADVLTRVDEWTRCEEAVLVEKWFRVLDEDTDMDDEVDTDKTEVSSRLS